MKPQRLGRRGPAPLVSGGKHPVSLLGEYCSKQKLGPPEYNLCFECGPDHKKNFLFKVSTDCNRNMKHHSLIGQCPSLNMIVVSSIPAQKNYFYFLAI